MKPDWDELGEKFEKSKKVIIGDVDCTESGKSLCEKFGIEGYPTIMSFAPGESEGEKYEGDRDLKALKKFAKKLGPKCSVDNWKLCSQKQKDEMEPYLKMERADLESQIAELKGKQAAAQAAHDELMKSLQSQYKASEDGLKKIKEEVAPQLKLLKSALPKEKPVEEAPTEAPKDEM